MSKDSTKNTVLSLLNKLTNDSTHHPSLGYLKAFAAYLPLSDAVLHPCTDPTEHKCIQGAMPGCYWAAANHAAQGPGRADTHTLVWSVLPALVVCNLTRSSSWNTPEREVQKMEGTFIYFDSTNFAPAGCTDVGTLVCGNGGIKNMCAVTYLSAVFLITGFQCDLRASREGGNGKTLVLLSN